jgi:hypothetical protein
LLGSHIARLWGVASCSGRLAVCPATGLWGGHLRLRLLLRLLLLWLTAVGRDAGLLLLLAVFCLMHASVGGGNGLHRGKQTVGSWGYGRGLLAVCRSHRRGGAIPGGLGCLLSWHRAIPTLLLRLLGHAVSAGLLLRLLADIPTSLLLLLATEGDGGSAAGGLSCCCR